MLNHETIASSQSLFAQLWKEYALSDSRYLTSDFFMLSVESITVVSVKQCAPPPPLSQPPPQQTSPRNHPHTDRIPGEKSSSGDPSVSSAPRRRRGPTARCGTRCVWWPARGTCTVWRCTTRRARASSGSAGARIAGPSRSTFGSTTSGLTCRGLLCPPVSLVFFLLLLLLSTPFSPGPLHPSRAIPRDFRYAGDKGLG